MTDQPPAFDLLHQRYTDSFPRKRSEIERAWQQVLHTGGEEGARADLQRLVHRLAGSAPAYGFEAIGTLARGVEEHLLQAPRPARPPDLTAAPTGDLHASIQALIDALAAQEHPAPANAAETSAPPAPVRVILVLDSVEQARELREHLERQGLVVQHVADSAALWQMLVTWPCQAIVLDYWLHGETAAEIAGMLGRESSFARIARICLANDPAAPLEQAALAAGCDAFVLKSGPVEALVATIHRYVAQRQAS